jgi:hypothetical protein
VGFSQANIILVKIITMIFMKEGKRMKTILSFFKRGFISKKIDKKSINSLAGETNWACGHESC